MSAAIRFGTDGWRAIIAEDYTFANVRACAASVVRFLRESGLDGRGLVIGYDTRFGSERFAAAVAEVVTAAGIRCYLSDRAIPTPTASYSILDRKAGGAVVITASHNPAEWNGFKYKPEYAGSASPEVVARLETHIAAVQADGDPPRLPLTTARAQGLLVDLDATAPYRAQLGRLVDLERIRAAGFRVVVDPMFGTGAGWIASVAGGGATVVTEINAERNPIFPGISAPEPIARNLQRLSAAIIEAGASVGIATDGDSDRLGIMDERGVFLTQLQVFALLCYYLLEVRGERGPIVKSLTTTRMAERLGELYGVPVHETGVGFKFLGPKMIETDAIIGGEESGGYGFRRHVPERDGILAGLLFLDLMARTGRKPSELLADLYTKVGPHHYDRVDIHYPAEQREAILRRAQEARPGEVAGLRVTSMDTVDGFRFNLEDGGWLLMRFSGTEPVLRVYAEVREQAAVPRVLEAGKALVGLA